MRYLLPIVIAHLLVCCFLGYQLSISSDESCSLATTDGSLIRTFTQSVAFEWQPPLYFLLLWFWRLIDRGIFWARLLSVLISTASVISFWQFSHRISRPEAAWPKWATFLFALHPFMIGIATDIRLYALGVWLSVLQLDLLCRTLLRNEEFPVKRTILVGIISLHTNILLGLGLAAQQLISWLFGSSKLSKQHLFCMVVIGLLYIPMFGYQLWIHPETDNPLEYTSILDYTKFVVGSISYNIISLSRDPSTILIRQLVTIVVSFILIFGWLRIGKEYDSQRTYRVLVSYLFILAGLLLAFLFLMNLLTAPRYTYPLFAVSLAVLGVILDSSLEPRLRTVAWLILVATALSTGFSGNRSLCKPGDVLRVGNHLGECTEPGAVVLCFPSEAETMLSRYNATNVRLIPIPSKQRMDRFLLKDFDIPDESTLRQQLAPLLGEQQRFWVVLLDDALEMSSVRHNQIFLDRFLSESFSEIRATQFQGATVKEFSRTTEKAPN